MYRIFTHNENVTKTVHFRKSYDTCIYICLCSRVPYRGTIIINHSAVPANTLAKTEHAVEILDLLKQQPEPPHFEILVP